MGNFAWGVFFIEWWGSDEEWFWQFKPFLKLKTTLCKYWTLANRLLKNKNGTGAMTVAKVSIELEYENCCLVGLNETLMVRNKNLVGGVYWG